MNCQICEWNKKNDTKKSAKTWYETRQNNGNILDANNIFNHNYTNVATALSVVVAGVATCC